MIRRLYICTSFALHHLSVLSIIPCFHLATHPHFPPPAALKGSAAVPLRYRLSIYILIMPT